MKKILLLFVSSIAFSQQFPIGAYRVLSDYGNNPAIQTQAGTIFHLCQNAFFNNAMIYVLHNDTTHVQAVLDSANTYGINIILPSVVDYYTDVERYYMDATKFDYFTTIAGLAGNDNDVEKPIGADNILSDNQSLQATVKYVSMVSGAKISPYRFKQQIYRATFRLKYQRSGSVSPATPVAYLEVTKGGIPIAPSLTLYDSSFAAQSTYQRFSIDFNSGTIGSYISPPETPTSAVHAPLDIPPGPGSGGQIDYVVEWIGPSNTTTIWLDNIRIDGAQSFDDQGLLIPDHYNGPWVWTGSIYDWPRRYRGPNFTDSLFNGYFDPILVHNATTYINKPRLQRFYFTDEPGINQFMSVRYVNSVLSQKVGANPATGKGLGHQVIEESMPFDRYSIEAKPFEIATDPYRFHYYDPKPGDNGYTDAVQLGDGTDYSGLQTQIAAFRLAQQNSVNTLSHNWWFYPNVGLYATSQGMYSREPTISEIKVQVNLALAYGAKGILYYNFWTDTGYVASYQPNGFGVLGLINTDMTPITSSRYGENKWAGITAINQALAGSLGTTLMGLTWQGAKSWHNGATAGTWSSIVSAIDAKSGGISDNPDYVETGHLTDISGANYVFAVNRRTLSSDTRDILISLKDRPTEWKVFVVGTSGPVITSDQAIFTSSYAPGEGKLIQLIQQGPTVPQNVAVTSYGGDRHNPAHAKVSWSKNIPPPGLQAISGYEIYRSTVQGTPGTLIVTTSATDSFYVDMGVNVGSGGMTIYYQVKAKDVTALHSAYSAQVSIGSSNWQQGNNKTKPVLIVQKPSVFAFKPNYPNPFNPATTISYDLPQDVFVTIKIYNDIGQEVQTLVSGQESAGSYSVRCNASNLPSGIYFCNIHAGVFTESIKMLLMK